MKTRVKIPSASKFYDRFDLVFLVTIVTVALLLLVDLNQRSGCSVFLGLIVTVLTATMLLLAVAAAGVGRRGLLFAWIAAGMTVAASILVAFSPGSHLGTGGLLWLLLVISTPILVLRRLIQHSTVTAGTVLGAISVYLLMAIAGTYLFLWLDSIAGEPGRFFGGPEPTTVFMYFSLVTITTLGYGDFNPAEVFGRAAAVWLAVTGQIYLVVVVARMVTMFGGFDHRQSESDSDDGD
jgi:hypothetical protein